MYKGQVVSFIRHLVSMYARYDKISESYSLLVKDLPSEEVNQLLSIYISDPSLSSEALGADNPAYDTYMLPALILHLNNSQSKSYENDFVEKWRDGIRSYFEERIQKIIDEECGFLFGETMIEKGFVKQFHRDNGEVFWS